MNNEMKQISIKTIEKLHKFLSNKRYPEVIYKGKMLELLTKSFEIIVEKQTNIGFEEFFNALTSDALVGPNGYETPKGSTIRLAEDSPALYMYGYNDKGGAFMMCIRFDKNGIHISNECEVEHTLKDGRPQKIICNIPESFTANGYEKHEESHFIIPDDEPVIKSFDSLFLSNAESSISRAIGRDFTENDKETLKNGEPLILHDKNKSGTVFFDDRKQKIVISEQCGNLLTDKSYKMGFDKSLNEPCVVYKKDEVLDLRDPLSSVRSLDDDYELGM